ncbi:MAG: MBL fold metallo-hydrolase [Anaerolineales bacterium]|nr:MBL fold metallo-hydrolase [Anaerolineales bacterium]
MNKEERVGDFVIVTFVVGPAATNAYLVGNSGTDSSVVIDPAWQGEMIVKEAERRGWKIGSIWLTHAHFDHFGGAAAVADATPGPPPVALHPEDMSLWRLHGGAALFGFPTFDPGPEPTIDLEHGMELQLDTHSFEVRHTPGHTQGHVMFLQREAEIAFCGDLIFQGSVGRTDLPGGDWQTLMKSIREDVLNLSDETRLFSGHGPMTTVGHERLTNPFITGEIHL